jgi:hypothetical protein
VLRGDDPCTEAEVTVKAIHDWERLPMKKAWLWGNDYHCERHIIGNDNVGERICRLSGKTRVESMPSRNFVNLVKVFFFQLWRSD